MYKINKEINQLIILSIITAFVYMGHSWIIFRIIEITKNEEDFKYILLFLIPLIYMNLKLFFVELKNISTIINLNILLKTGTLFQNLDYISDKKGISKRRSEIKYYQPIINFAHPNGNKIIMKGKYNKNILEPSITGKIDLIVDLNKPKIYFIDFDLS